MKTRCHYCQLAFPIEQMAARETYPVTFTCESCTKKTREQLTEEIHQKIRFYNDVTKEATMSNTTEDLTILLKECTQLALGTGQQIIVTTDHVVALWDLLPGETRRQILKQVYP